ncbi:hypothetical protein [Halodesulfovibrio sp. MK-HDV]|jgi:hypothetical protein|uniref:hypothetical protein n=1 Tax=unclassified Halodesulfovibrio TaxID=2644657 RepID=UPI00137076D7|nr:hypothetical protein [Halodesulfovibrio sp. MK-HDV]KAF1076708.1 hypothetical protein MKHDV_00837 [Halodesulfovibrio sp. MK-HDV]
MTEETVWPDKTDTDLWEEVRAAIIEKHGDRFDDAHMRKAFDLTCDHFEDYVSRSRFFKKALMNCVWERPIISKEQQVY